MARPAADAFASALRRSDTVEAVIAFADALADGGAWCALPPRARGARRAWEVPRERERQLSTSPP